MKRLKSLIVCALLALMWSTAVSSAGANDLHVMVSGAFTAAYIDQLLAVRGWDQEDG
jgi:putative cell wall-binding protein